MDGPVLPLRRVGGALMLGDAGLLWLFVRRLKRRSIISHTHITGTIVVSPTPVVVTSHESYQAKPPPPSSCQRLACAHQSDSPQILFFFFFPEARRASLRVVRHSSGTAVVCPAASSAPTVLAGVVQQSGVVPITTQELSS